MSKVGFVGLGIMGTPMAGHLLAVATRSSPTTCAARGVAGRAGGEGLRVRQGSRAAFRDRHHDGADTPHVAAALFDPNGIAEGLAPGKIVVDMSSISPSRPRRSPSASTRWAAPISTRRSRAAKSAPRRRA